MTSTEGDDNSIDSTASTVGGSDAEEPFNRDTLELGFDNDHGQHWFSTEELSELYGNPFNNNSGTPPPLKDWKQVDCSTEPIQIALTVGLAR